MAENVFELAISATVGLSLAAKAAAKIASDPRRNLAPKGASLMGDTKAVILERVKIRLKTTINLLSSDAATLDESR